MRRLAALVFVVLAGCGEPAAPEPIEALPEPAEIAVAPRPPDTERFRELWGSTLRIEEETLGRYRLRAVREGAVVLALRGSGGQVEHSIEVVVSPAGPRTLPPVRANVSLSVGDDLWLALPVSEPPYEWTQHDPGSVGAEPREVLGPLRRSDDIYERASLLGSALANPQRAGDPDADDFDYVRFDVINSGTVRLRDGPMVTVLRAGEHIEESASIVDPPHDEYTPRVGDTVFWPRWRLVPDSEVEDQIQRLGALEGL